MVNPSLQLSALHEAASRHLVVRNSLGTPLVCHYIDNLADREILLTLLQEFGEKEQLDLQAPDSMEIALHMEVDSRNDTAMKELLAAEANHKIKNIII